MKNWLTIASPRVRLKHCLSPANDYCLSDCSIGTQTKNRNQSRRGFYKNYRNKRNAKETEEERKRKKSKKKGMREWEKVKKTKSEVNWITIGCKCSMFIRREKWEREREKARKRTKRGESDRRLTHRRAK